MSQNKLIKKVSPKTFLALLELEASPPLWIFGQFCNRRQECAVGKFVFGSGDLFFALQFGHFLILGGIAPSLRFWTFNIFDLDVKISKSFCQFNNIFIWLVLKMFTLSQIGEIEAIDCARK